jgi:hypothetical protein
VYLFVLKYFLHYYYNSTAITRDRFVHHTSFLWDFDPRNMQYLLVRLYYGHLVIPFFRLICAYVSVVM